MRKGHKQYFVMYESDQKICGRNDHNGGNASSIKSAKAIICSIKKEMANYNPHNFRIYDCFADVDETTNFVPCVYNEM